MRKVANSMANVMHFAILILIPLVANSLAIESFGQAQDFVVQQKPDKGKEFDWEAYEASIDRQVPNMDDEEYHHDDNSADEFSFILHDYGHFADKQSTPDSTFKVQKKEDCKHKCENICYNPLTHQCCGNNKTSTMVLWGFWTCSECEHKCEARCYPKTEGYKCCFGKVIPDAWQCCPHHCGSTCFDAYTKRCCNGQIIERSRICCKHYCGDNCYEPFNTSCCNNEVVAKDALCCKDKCGNACYDKAKQQCCNGQAIPIGNKCCPVGQTVCGSACYVAGTHKCCHQRTIAKSLPCLSGSGNLVRITSGLSARKVGCFRDTGNRAIPTLEGKSRLLVEHYRSRHFAIEKCALAAAQRGWSVFAVQHQGWCASSPTASVTYNKYGPYNTCWNNKGGPWGNDVYVLEGNSHQRTTLGEICVFPFVYKGKSYHGCTRIDRNHPWCAVTPNYDVDGIWGFCKS